jgi:hypothetical protein
MFHAIDKIFRRGGKEREIDHSLVDCNLWNGSKPTPEKHRK